MFGKSRNEAYNRRRGGITSAFRCRRQKM